MGAVICLPLANQNSIVLAKVLGFLGMGTRHVRPEEGQSGDFTQAIGNEMQSARLLREGSVCLKLLEASCYHAGRASLSEFREGERERLSSDETELLVSSCHQSSFLWQELILFHPFIFLSHEWLGFL